jgi:predicted MPP superfamily phosphohydrolase
VLWEPRTVRVTAHTVPTPDLHPDLDGIRVAQLTDVHLGSGHAAARRCAELLSRLRPEVVVLTGDIVETPSELSVLGSWLREVRGTLATVQVMGNWEHWGGLSPGAVSRACDRGGAQLLFNETLTIRRGAGTLHIVGLDDADEDHGNPNPEAALRGTTHDPAIWLAHSPGWVDGLETLLPQTGLPAPAFILSGHTHGGQVRHPFGPLVTPHGSGRFVRGWYRDSAAPLYVSQGVGTSLLPVRLFCRPELPVFTLRSV